MMNRLTLLSVLTTCVYVAASPASLSLSHEFHLGEGAQTVFQDTPRVPSVTLATVPTSVYRPRNIDAYNRARRRSLFKAESEPVEWDLVHTYGPDMEDQHTIVELGRMAGNAYAGHPGQKNWYDLDATWNVTFPFGYEDPADGFRGHVFHSPENDLVVLSIKGTTVQGPTSKKDKFNDNLLFSCCCARVDFTWTFKKVCDCYKSGWRCDSICLSEALIEESLFYTVGINLVADITAMYPTATIWLVGHSLGGALASLLGTTFGLPAVAFEAPGERMAAHRLHLPLPPASRAGLPLTPVTHVYHTADPIPQGACTGLGSPCVAAGYALETHCHLGKTILYDTVGRLGWHVDVRTHRIADVITRLLELDEDWEDGRKVPIAREEVDCVDCFKWEFEDFHD
ncbi:alpha/beta-hydrolase [Peniophora sp. CONT]|nr:alpha/beta-hydrolase [Peniophora sp. CONT]